ncbi:type II toxin-antitoxin system RelE/ParE family toxin [Crenothrix sp.]|uniref:type II toxin-antitoxin system RelE/ParE family toxin n=1 Tax=Crenothrix sp. TaxID=3100433 RepID=UPI00374D8D46
MIIINHIQILADAEYDLYEARDFYDKQGKNIGDYFWDSILSDIESLMIFVGVHKKDYGYYRMLAKRFPYAIYYDVNQDVASVIAVLPLRRNPVWIKDKMSNRN